MSATLRRRTDNLLSGFWSRAKPIEVEALEEVRRLMRPVEVLFSSMLDAWFRADPNAAELGEKMGRKETASLPPIHREFLPEYLEPYRRQQWALYHRPDLQEISQAFWSGFLEHIQARYNLEGGLMDIAVPLFEEQVSVWNKQLAYIGVTCDPETLTRDLVLYHQIYVRELRKVDTEQYEQVQQRAKIEWIQELYGREIRSQEIEAENKLWADLDKDMEAGKPASESKAAIYFRDLFDRYPHKTRAGLY